MTAARRPALTGRAVGSGASQVRELSPTRRLSDPQFDHSHPLQPAAHGHRCHPQTGHRRHRDHRAADYDAGKRQWTYDGPEVRGRPRFLPQRIGCRKKPFDRRRLREMASRTGRLHWPPHDSNRQDHHRQNGDDQTMQEDDDGRAHASEFEVRIEFVNGMIRNPSTIPGPFSRFPRIALPVRST